MEEEKGKADSFSPDTVLEDLLRRADTDSDSSKPSTSEQEPRILLPKPASIWLDFLPLLSRFKSKTQQSTSLIPPNAFRLSKTFSCSKREKSASSSSDSLTDSNFNYFRPQWSSFSYQELLAATSNFFQGYLIGKGGYAEVYRGRLRGGQLVAVKRLTRVPFEERVGDFLSELGIMAHVNHPNTAKLIGYGVESGLYLVLEFSPIGSLASLLHS